MTVVREQAWEVRNRLGDLGLEAERLRDVVRRGHLAFLTCTENHPPFVTGIWAWAETVRALREYVLPLGWRRSDENSYSVVIDPSDELAIAVATGDESTGQAGQFPTTKTPKGPITIDIVESNQFQLALFSSPTSKSAPVAEPEEDAKRLTWMLLIHRAKDEVRCELSLPSSMGADGRPNAWGERILLEAIPLVDDSTDVGADTQTEVTVEVKRRL